MARRDSLKRQAAEHRVDVTGDNDFQRRARLLQALWREEQGLPIGLRSSKRPEPLGSRLAMPFARETLANYVTETIRDVVRAEVLDPVKSADKLYGKPRIFEDLLSSQPLCFNLFGELQRDLPLASAVLGPLTDGRVHHVAAIEFEHSPGRGDPRFTGDRSAFDVFIEFEGPRGPGFLGIEVKYHENLKGGTSKDNDRYHEIADAMGVFDPTRRGQLLGEPLQQIWRDHLLAGSLRLDGPSGYDDGAFVFLYPAQNKACADAIGEYAACLTNKDSLIVWALEEVVAALRAATDAAWVEAVADRYLGFHRLEGLA
ncbi:MAG: hypothetical protein OXI03_10870 [Chloroflexota bacterium]|nr:hypothetical protein [Chloroflexota bacterium]